MLQEDQRKDVSVADWIVDPEVVGTGIVEIVAESAPVFVEFVAEIEAFVELVAASAEFVAIEVIEVVESKMRKLEVMLDTEQMRKLQLSEDDRILMNKFKEQSTI